MTTMKRNITILSLLALAMAVPMAGNAQTDSIRADVDFVGGTAINLEDNDDFPEMYIDGEQNKREDGQTSAYVARLKRGGYFLVEDSLFQRVQISKFYRPKKKFLDHAMLDLGVGIMYGKGRDNIGHYGMGVKPDFRLSIGDWVTPEHGWRANILMGKMPAKGYYTPAAGGELVKIDPLYYGVGADYLLNISALANRVYDKPKLVEFIGTLGADLSYLDYKGGSNKPLDRLGISWHMGLRGMYNFSKTNYVYLEPYAAIYRPGNIVSNVPGSDKHAIGYGLRAGIGFRRNPLLATPVGKDTLFSAGNDWFFQMAGGIGAPSDNLKKMSPQMLVAVGKWLNRTQGLRLRVNASTVRLYPDKARQAALGIGADYMWNISRSFALNPTSERTQEPRFGIVYLLGANFNGVDTFNGIRTYAAGAGMGLQFNYRIRRMTDFYLEPRVDIYTKEFYPGYPEETPDRVNIVPSILAGFTFHQGMHTQWLRESRSSLFQRHSWFHHLFFQASVGATAPITTATIRSRGSHYLITPKAFIAMGKWFTPVHGLRLYAEGGSIRQKADVPYSLNGAVGAEYLWNITNTLEGYLPDRHFEVLGAVGVNFGIMGKKINYVYPGLSLGMQAHYNITPNWSLFLEPQLRIYGKKYLPYAGSRIDPVAAIMAGVQLRALDYDRKLQLDSFRVGGNRRTFYGVAAGITAPVRYIHLGMLGRFSLGRWFTPLSALRGNVTIGAYPHDFHLPAQRNIRFSLGADYLLDLTNMCYGYKPDRLLNLRALLGGNISVGAYSLSGAQFDADVHTGLQLAFRLPRAFELYVEPQLAYNIDHAFSRSTLVTPIAYIGMNKEIIGVDKAWNRMYNRVRAIRQHNLEETPWEDENKVFNKIFYEIGGGPHLLWSRAASYDLRHYMGLGAYMSIGRWINHMHGVRVRIYGARDYKPVGEPLQREHTESLGFGAEYALSISNAIWKYNPDRLFDVNGYVGPTFTYIRNKWHVRLGANLALQGLLNINRTYSLFLQPEITFYGKQMIYPSSLKSNFTTDLMFGLQVHPENYDRKLARQLFDEHESHGFASLAGGLSAPLRDLVKRGFNPLGGYGRVSYGQWFLPTSAWRFNIEGWGFPHNSYNQAMSLGVGGGFDYLLDLATLSRGYNIDRVFGVRPLAGFNMGATYYRHRDARFHFQADVHVGTQISVRLARNWEIYAEPAVAYRWGGVKPGSRLAHVYPRLFAGLNYVVRDPRHPKLQDDSEDPSVPRYKNFVSVGGGLGCNTYTIINGYRKLTGDMSVNVGHWFSTLSGVRAGLDYSNVNLAHRTPSTKNWPEDVPKPVREPHKSLHNGSVHVDYLLNVYRILSGDYEHVNKRVEIFLYAGFNYTISGNENRPLRKGFGAEAGFQIAGRVAKHISIFVEPGASLTSPKIYGQPHPLEGCGRVIGGLKYCF